MRALPPAPFDSLGDPADPTSWLALCRRERIARERRLRLPPAPDLTAEEIAALRAHLAAADVKFSRRRAQGKAAEAPSLSDAARKQPPRQNAWMAFPGRLGGA